MNPALLVECLSVFYGKRVILRDLSFCVDEREFFVIIGPNGSGKTTLLKVLSGALKPKAGNIQVFGSSLRNIPRKTLARSVALVPQYPPMDIPFTVAEVVLMGRSPHLGMLSLESREDVVMAERAMDFTNVGHLAHSKLDHLSAGERQRVLIARAICQQAGMILLDEPTASLDPAHQVHIMDLMDKLRSEQGVTIIMVSHDLNLAAMYASRMLLLDNGSIAASGDSVDVLQPALLKEVYRCSLLVDENPLKQVPRVTPVPAQFVDRDNLV